MAADSSSVSYAGDVSPAEAWEALSQNPSAKLIDVRTVPEWQFVGLPDLSPLGKEPVLLSWKMYPHMEVNRQFAEQLSRDVPEKDTPLYFLCKVGGRSLDAAMEMAQHGYTKCHNIACGFEGDITPDGKRGSLNGWKASQLAWKQS